jgi:glycosyltransferase involved in cell wall biosynthesis
MKILTIGHNFVVRENQKHLDELKKIDPNIELKLITPIWWFENTMKIHQERPSGAPYPIVRCKTFFTGNNTLFFYFGRLIKEIINFKPDIIEAYEEPWSLSLLQIVLIKKLFRLKTKITCYSAQNIHKRFPFPFNIIEKFNLKNVKGIHICSNEIKNILKQKQYTGIIEKIGLGIDLSKFKYKQKNRTNMLQIGYVGRIVKSKGIFDLSMAIKKIPNCHLHIGGSGSDENTLKEYINKNNLTSRVTFHGSLGLDKMISFYHSIDILIVPSRTTTNWKEQFGRIIVEAYATGASVIGSDSGSIPEIIDNYGLTFKEGNVPELINCINDIKDNEQKWNKLKKDAKEYVNKTFSWQAIAKSYYNFYASITRIT